MELLFLAWTLWMTQQEKKEGENSGCVGIIFPLASGKWENMREVIRGKRTKKPQFQPLGGKKEASLLDPNWVGREAVWESSKVT